MTKPLEILKTNIANKTARIGIIGLGYVGLPVAAIFADEGFDTLGIDILPKRVSTINSGKSPIEGDEPGLSELIKLTVESGKLRATTQYSELNDRDVILVDVETPVNDQNIPEYTALRSALTSLSQVMKKHVLVIIESTIAPGTMASVVLPIIKSATGWTENRDFFLGNCPERVMPGKLLANLHNLSRVVGGGNPETADTMILLYQNIVKADLDPVDWITAELVKTTENAYRDVQIAFANEVAQICEALGADVMKVRDLVNKSPYRNMHIPGAGVGGHCIPKDPWLLAYGVNDKGIALKVIPAARAVNDYMPIHVVELLIKALARVNKDINDSKILVLGYSYLENSDDTRNSPSVTLINEITRQGGSVVIHDPFVDAYTGDLYDMAQGCDAVVIMVAHSEYKMINLERLRNMLITPVFVDGRHVFNKQQLIQSQFIFSILGG